MKLRDWITACSCHAPTEAILLFALSLLHCSGAECCYSQWLQWPAQVTLLDLLGTCRGVIFLLPGSRFKLGVMLCSEDFMNVHFCSLSFIIGLRILCWLSSLFSCHFLPFCSGTQKVPEAFCYNGVLFQIITCYLFQFMICIHPPSKTYICIHPTVKQ